MKPNVKLACCAAAVFAVATAASVPARAGAVDVVQAPTGYFVPTDAQKYDSPYYRYSDMGAGPGSGDWGWTQGALATPYTTATLQISAFDVDYTAPGFLGERDAIYIGTNTSGIFLGYLNGGNDIWAYTNFDVSAYSTEIAAGLQIFMSIDQNQELWAVTLAKSVLTLDDGQAPNPEPNSSTTPLPAALPLFATGLGALGLLGWRRKRKAQAAA